MRYAGADGCRAGWLTVVLTADALFQPPVVCGSLTELVLAQEGASALLVDIPMGLKEAGDERRCDLETRRRLGSRGSSIFRVPVRSAAYAPDHPTASERNRAATGKGLSIQCFGICAKIVEADRLLRAKPGLQDWVHESHPEACFAALNGWQPLAEMKTSPEGQERRLELLSRHVPNAADTFTEARERYRRSDVALDDILDAMVLALAARLAHEAGLPTIPAEPEIDPHGLRMVMVVPPAQAEAESRRRREPPSFSRWPRSTTPG